MGEDDVSSQISETSRILEEHSYYKMQRNTLPYSKRIELLTSNETTWPPDNNKGKCVNGNERSLPTKEKIVKKKARVEDIIKNLKKGKTMIKKPTKVSDENSSFVSMCTIREEHDDIELDLPPLKPYNDQPELKQDTNAVLFVSSAEQTGTQSTMYLGRSTPPTASTPQILYQTMPQNKDNQQMPLILNRVSPANNMNNGRNNTPQGTTMTPLQQQRKLLFISRPGAVPVYLNVQDKFPTSSSANVRSTGTNSRSSRSDTQGGSAQAPFIIQYRLPYPNDTCKIVNNPPSNFPSLGQTSHTLHSNLVCNETLPAFRQSVVTSGNRFQKPLDIPVNFAGNQMAHVTAISDHSDMAVYEQPSIPSPFVAGTTFKTSLTKQNKEVDYKGTTKLGRPPEKNLVKIKKQHGTKTASNKRDHTEDNNISRRNSNSQIKTNQGRHVLPSVRVSNRKKHRTEKALMMDKNQKRTTNKRKDILQLRYAKKGKRKPQVQVTAEPVGKACIANTEHMGNSRDPKSSSDKEKEVQVKSENDVTSSEDVIDLSKDTNESGNLLRDPALLTREERALQRALMLFKEMENKQAKKRAPNERTEKSMSVNKAKRNLRKRKHQMNINKLKQLHKNVKLPQKRRQLVNSPNDNSFLKRRKLNVEQRATQGKAVKSMNALAKSTHENVNKNGRKRPRSLNDGDTEVPTNVKHRRKKLAEKVIKGNHIAPEPGVKSLQRVKEATSSAKVSSQLKLPQIKIKSPPLPQMKSSLVQDKSPPTQTKSLPQNLKSPSVHLKSPSTKPEKSKDAQEKHRVKTYMLIPSYHGFKDFSPVLLGSRTRNKKVETAKSDTEDGSSPAVTKKADTPKKDVPLLVIETVNNKPVKQDVVIKDEQLRDLVTNSLRAQGMLKRDLEKKGEDEYHFENREKRNITVNRNTGETVLHKAARMGYDETVYHSIQQGCNGNAKDYAGWTPLHEACSRGHSDVVKVLVKYNADVNACSNDGIRPIHDAADNGNTDSLRLLIAYGADPLLSTYSGRACLDCAKKPEAKEYIKGCIGDLYLTDERNTTVELDYEDRWEFRGSCSVLDKDAKYINGIFDNIPAAKRGSSSVEFEWSDTPHLPTYNLPLKKDGVITGRKNYLRFQDLQGRLGKSRSTLIRLLKRTEIREVPWSEFSKEVSRSCFNKLFESPAGSSTEEVKVEMVPLNWNVRCLLKIKSENISL